MGEQAIQAARLELERSREELERQTRRLADLRAERDQLQAERRTQRDELKRRHAAVAADLTRALNVLDAATSRLERLYRDGEELGGAEAVLRTLQHHRRNRWGLRRKRRGGEL